MTKQIAAVFGLLALCFAANAQKVTEVTPDTVSKLHHFGFAVGMSGDFAMIGAYSDSRQNVYHRGIVYVYRELRNKWTLVGEKSWNLRISNTCFSQVITCCGVYSSASWLATL